MPPTNGILVHHGMVRDLFRIVSVAALRPVVARVVHKHVEAALSVRKRRNRYLQYKLLFHIRPRQAQAEERVKFVICSTRCCFLYTVAGTTHLCEAMFVLRPYLGVVSVLHATARCPEGAGDATQLPRVMSVQALLSG
jgi:hypothetical protein